MSIRLPLLAFLLSAFPFFAFCQENEMVQHAKRAQAAIASNDNESAVRELNAMLRLDPANVDAHANLGMVRFTQGQFNEAKTQFEAALMRSPRLWSAKAFLGMCEFRLGRAEHGRTLIEEALPKVNDAALRRQSGIELVNYYVAAKMPERASTVLKLLQQADPHDPEILYMAYRVYSDAATLALKNLAAAGPDTPYIHAVLGQNYVSQDQFAKAEQEFRRAIELGPRLLGLHYQLGQALFSQARTEENRKQAETAFLEELALNPTDGPTVYKLGEIAAERSDYAAAKNRFEQALALRPDLAEAHLGLGRILELEGDLRGAAQQLEAAVHLTPDDKIVHYRLARLLRTQGREADADREMAEFRRLSAAEAPPGPQKP
jgi:Flp pilus assembly protein TadD